MPEVHDIADRDLDALRRAVGSHEEVPRHGHIGGGALDRAAGHLHPYPPSEGGGVLAHRPQQEPATLG